MKMAVFQHEYTGGTIPEDLLLASLIHFTKRKNRQRYRFGVLVSYGIVGGMGGKISAENTDSGACFKIILPIISLYWGLLEKENTKGNPYC
jgi:K+-sensing histidine kinase KdpD